MRTNAIVLCIVLAAGILPASARADLIITELWNVDPGWEAGGYWEFTVTNATGAGVYMIAVGNNGATLTVVRYPDLVDVWEPTRVGPDEWDVNDWGRRPTDWPFPDTSLYPFATEFPGYEQVIVYYVLGSNPPLADGAVLDGLYFNYPQERATASRVMAASGSPYLVFGGNGEVVARGQTAGTPLPVQPSTWGAVKALYR